MPTSLLALVLLATHGAPATSALQAGEAVLVAGDGLNEPFAVDFGGAGEIYIAEMGGHRIRVLDRHGTLSLLAGTGEKGLGGDGGPATLARFNGPHHLLLGPDGHLYIADTFNNCVRKVDLRTGLVTRVAGTGEKGFSGDGGPAREARFGGIYSIAFHEGTLYACDLDNRRIRAIDLRTGVVTTVAGNGEKGVPRDGEDARSQPLVDPRAVAVDSRGHLYICERGGHALRVVDPAGRIRTVAGTGEAGFSGDGGLARAARLNGPKHISVDAGDGVLISDTENHVVRRYSPVDGTIHRVAGTGQGGAAGLGGPADRLELFRPHGALAHPRTGAIYVSDSENHRVVRLEKGPEFVRAAANGDLVREGLERCHRYLHAWLRAADPQTGLIPRNLKDSHYWNGKDSAADNYPFLVLSADFTDRTAFDGKLRAMLASEERLTRRDGWLRLTDDFSLDTHRLVHPTGDATRIYFNSAEYVKDGLIPLTEWLGPSDWSRRLVGLLDDIWTKAAVETPFGNIPLDGRNTEVGVEVNGDLLQALARVYWMSGRDEKYLRWATRLADFYLLPEGRHHPSRDFTVLRMRDHGCEIMTGLSELYATLHLAGRLPGGGQWATRKTQYQPHLHELLDRILEVGRNEHGMFYDEVNPQTGEVRGNGRLADTWGYVADGFYTVYLIDGTEAYRNAALQPLSALRAHYSRFEWEPNGAPLGSADGYADSIEGALNLLNRAPGDPAAVSAEAWVDSEIRVMWAKQQSDGIVEGWHGDGNFARTTLMHALWKTQGVTFQPWRDDVRLGAVAAGDGLFLSLRTERPWRGRLVFDRPRHADFMKLPIDWPRINQFPEWFVTTGGSVYRVTDVGGGAARSHSAADMRRGIPVETGGGSELRLRVDRMPTASSGPGAR
jgi:DNA-binding beta-propeller fold protein YncE